MRVGSSPSRVFISKCGNGDRGVRNSQTILFVYDEHFLGTFAKLRKRTISWVISVRTSVRPST